VGGDVHAARGDERFQVLPLGAARVQLEL
jgi:hypothetical protein